MSRSLVERRLSSVTQRLRRAREELEILDQQIAALAETAEEYRIRALVAETPIAEHEHHDAQRHVSAMQGSRAELAATIADLQRSQDDLLHRLVP